MNRIQRHERRALLKQRRDYIATIPDELTEVSPQEMPAPPMEFKLKSNQIPVKAWVSRRYCVQLYMEGNRDFPHLMRLSVNRVVSQR